MDTFFVQSTLVLLCILFITSNIWILNNAKPRIFRKDLQCGNIRNIYPALDAILEDITHKIYLIVTVHVCIYSIHLNETTLNNINDEC